MRETRTSAISRRGFVASALTLPLLAGTGVRAAEAVPRPDFRQAFVYRFRIGSIEAWCVSDCDFGFRDGLSLMHPEDERPKMLDEMKRHGESADLLPLYANILVIRKGSDVAVFDAGFGNNGNPRMGWFREGLELIGIRPEQVTHGFLSHAHADHLNGFVLDGKPAFPNAAIHALPAEIAFWQEESPDFSRSRRDPKGIPGMIREVRSHFATLGDKLRPTPAGATFLGGAVTIESAPGHTAGHACFRIRSDGRELLHLMDLAHHHLLMFADPSWNIAFDHDPDAAIETRRKWWAMAAEKHTRCFGFHLPFPGLGRIVQSHATRYSWWPERWQWQA